VGGIDTQFLLLATRRSQSLNSWHYDIINNADAKSQKKHITPQIEDQARSYGWRLTVTATNSTVWHASDIWMRKITQHQVEVYRRLISSDKLYMEHNGSPIFMWRFPLTELKLKLSLKLYLYHPDMRGDKFSFLFFFLAWQAPGPVSQLTAKIEINCAKLSEWEITKLLQRCS